MRSIVVERKFPCFTQCSLSMEISSLNEVALIRFAWFLYDMVRGYSKADAVGQQK